MQFTCKGCLIMQTFCCAQTAADGFKVCAKPKGRFSKPFYHQNKKGGKKNPLS